MRHDAAAEQRHGQDSWLLHISPLKKKTVLGVGVRSLTSQSVLRFVADGRQMATFQLEGELRCRRQGVDTSERFAFAIQRSTREHEHIL